MQNFLIFALLFLPFELLSPQVELYPH
jgi:hypothetical protein